MLTTSTTIRQIVKKNIGKFDYSPCFLVAELLLIC